MKKVVEPDPKKFQEFSYFYIEEDEQEKRLIMVDRIGQVPEGEEVDFCTVRQAISCLQSFRFGGWSLHVIRNQYHELCLEVLRWYVKHKGEVFSVVYRGVRSDRLDSEYKIMFGSLSKEVASSYGKVKVYENIKGVKYLSTARSVITDDPSEMDEEVIFFPDIN